MGPDDDSREVLEVMLRWLQTSDARAAARSELHRRGLDVLDPDDIINDVVLRLAAASLPHDLTNPVAYARRALTLRALDVLRGERVQRRHRAPEPGLAEVDDPGDALVDVADDEAIDPGVEVALAAFEDDLRRGLHRRLAVAGTQAWAVAAALTTLTLRVHRDVAIPDSAPVPDVGTPSQADRWAALWLAGQRDAFPDNAAGREDSAAMRKARSRKLQQVERLLFDVAAAVLGVGGGAHG